MRNSLFRIRDKRVRVMPCAAAIQYECRNYVRQMALPLVSERRVKGALSLVSRDSGVSYSKLRKIYYGLTDHILAFEFRSIEQAYRRYLDQHEARLTEELEHLRALKALGAQHDLFDHETHTASLDAMDNTRRDTTP